MRLTILHITDLHVKSRITYEESKIDSMAEIINNDSNSEYVLLLLSGDISFSGEKEQFAIAKRFIDSLFKRINKNIKIAICPGNHDRTFGKNGKMLNGEIKCINSDNFYEAFDKYKFLNNNYAEFVNTYSSERVLTKQNPILEKYKFDFDASKVVVYSLNNALFSSFDPEGKEGKRCVSLLPRDMISIDRGNEVFSILLMHMPFREMEPNTCRFLKEKCKKFIDIIIDGHTHEESFSIEENELIELTSTAMHANELSGFSLIHINESVLETSLYYFDEDANKYVNRGFPIKEALTKKVATEDHLIIEEDVLARFNETMTLCGYDIRCMELFVFPRLTEHKYLGLKEKKKIDSFEDFLTSVNNKSIVIIGGNQGSGKTMLSLDLFKEYIAYGYSPVLCFGNNFSNKTRKTIKEQLDCQIKRNYCNSDITKLYYEINKKNRILIIDDGEVMTDSIISELSNYFDKIILITDTEADDVFSIKNTAKLPSLLLDIEFFYRTKREELYKNIYSSIEKRKPDIISSYNLEEYICLVDEAVEKIEQKILIDLETLIAFCANALVNVDILNGNDARFVANRYQVILTNFIKQRGIEGITPIIIERLLGRIAFALYEKKQTLFDEKMFDDEITKEIEEYDVFSYSNAHKILSLLVELRILKSTHEHYLFYSRNIFAHYIGFYAMHMNDNNNNDEHLKKIISNGVYQPLNFSILMDIAVSRNNANIPSSIIEMLTNDVIDYKFENQNVKSISIFFDEDRQRVVDIEKQDIEKRRELINKREKEQRQEYLDNANNYFYEKLVSDTTKQMIETFNKNRILAVLMNYGDYLRKDQKEKLCKLDLLYPNIVIDQYISYVKKDFENLYIKILDNVDDVRADKNFEKSFNSFFDFLLSFVTATILGIYDSSARPIHNRIMSKKVIEFVKQDNYIECSFMPDVQRLMFLSFSRDHKIFFEELKKYVEGTKNKYFIQCALLVARRVVIDNYEDVSKNNRQLLEYMKAKSGPRLLSTVFSNKK